MGEAVRDAGNVVLPELRDGKDRWQRPLLQWQLKALNPELGEPTDLAFVNLTEDDDQFVRRQQLLSTDGKRASMHFALALQARPFAQGLGLPGGILEAAKSLGRVGELRDGGRPFPFALACLAGEAGSERQGAFVLQPLADGLQ